LQFIENAKLVLFSEILSTPELSIIVKEWVKTHENELLRPKINLLIPIIPINSP